MRLGGLGRRVDWKGRGLHIGAYPRSQYFIAKPSTACVRACLEDVRSMCDLDATLVVIVAIDLIDVVVACFPSASSDVVIQ